MRLTRDEYEELLDHLEHSPAIWTRSDDNPSLWLRSDDASSPCGLQILEGEDLCEVLGHPIDASEEETRDYIDRLVRSWTSYGQRELVVKFLEDELKFDPETAEVVGIAITQIRTSVPSEITNLVADLPNVPEAQPLAHEIGLFQLVGGGYVHLQTRGGRLHATLSIPSRRKHLSFGPALTGFLSGSVRSHAVRTENVAQAISEGDNE